MANFFRYTVLTRNSWTNWSCQRLLISGTMSQADFPPIKHERSTVLSKLLATKQRKLRLQLPLNTLHSVSPKCKHFKENSLHSLNAFLEKYKRQKLSVCFQFYRLNQSLFASLWNTPSRLRFLLNFLNTDRLLASYYCLRYWNFRQLFSRGKVWIWFTATWDYQLNETSKSIFDDSTTKICHLEKNLPNAYLKPLRVIFARFLLFITVLITLRLLR